MSATPIISNPASFREEARHQGCCAVCGSGGGFHAHHVISRNWLRRNHFPEYDTRGALRLCVRCHFQFEHAGPGKVQVEVRHLTLQNLCYVREIMGEATIDFLRREYAYEGDEP
jgi:hypothetical protein